MKSTQSEMLMGQRGKSNKSQKEEDKETNVASEMNVN